MVVLVLVAGEEVVVELCPTCGHEIEVAKAKEWSGTLAPLQSLPEMLEQITTAVVDQYTPPVSLT